MPHLVQEHNCVQEEDLLALLLDAHEMDAEFVPQAEEGGRAAFYCVYYGAYKYALVVNDFVGELLVEPEDAGQNIGTLAASHPHEEDVLAHIVLNY
jgi:hypothetical protein